MKETSTFSISEEKKRTNRNGRMNFLKLRRLHERIQRVPSDFTIECILQYSRSVQHFMSGSNVFFRVLN